MASELCRWGILGAAEIAKKNWRAIANAGNARLIAVASRGLDRAERFIALCQSHTPHSPPPLALGSYEELLRRDDIDAVYIPLPTGVRKEWVLRAAEAGKHVLCEKPCALSSGDLREMQGACRRRQVQFMDGVMFMHSSRLAMMREVLDDGESVGAIRRISSAFTFRAGEGFQEKNIRASGELEPYGCLGDLGWYDVRFSLWAFGYELPHQVTGRLLSPAKTPMEFSGELVFKSGASAGFYCSFLAGNQQWAIISGEQGYLHARDFVLPFLGGETSFEVNSPLFDVDRCDFNMIDRPRTFAAAEYSGGKPNSQETNMFRTFSQIVASGRIEPRWGEISLATQQVVDACLISAKNGGAAVDPREI